MPDAYDKMWFCGSIHHLDLEDFPHMDWVWIVYYTQFVGNRPKIYNLNKSECPLLGKMVEQDLGNVKSNFYKCVPKISLLQ